MSETNKRQFPIIPHQRTPFIGRENELADIKRLLADPSCHLLTLLGPGGVGKTRLAIKAAGNAASDMDVYFVSLQPVTTAAAVLPTIADTLGLKPARDTKPITRLSQFLQEKQVLLILDNLEEVIDCADDLSELLAALPQTKMLVTSRELLNLQEEWLFPVEGLPLPPLDQSENLDEFGAVALFCDRAQRVRPDFSLMAEKTAVIKICQLTDGLPLALELAAPWLKMMTCAAIAQEIETNLNFLSSRMRNVPERHRSMQAVFNQSWQMLPSDEQQIYAHLSLFRGGFRREAAEKIADADLDTLTGFVEKSLLVWEANGRYHIHELLRQYAATHIDRSDLIPRQTQHSDYYTQFLHQRTADITGDLQQKATQEIHADLDNIRAAWQWAVQQGNAKAFEQSITPLAMFYQLQGKYLEAATMFEAAIEALNKEDPDSQRALGLLLSEMGWIAIRLGRFEQAEDVLHQCQTIYQQQHLKPPSGAGTDPLLGLGTLASIRGDYEKALTLSEQARQTAAAQNQTWNESTANYQLASSSYALGLYEQAMSYAIAAHTLTEQTQDHWFRAYCLIEMGKATQALGDLTAARRYFETSYSLREALADPEGMAVAMNHLGEVAWQQGNVAEAERMYTESAAIYQKIDDRGGLAAAYQGLGRTAVAQQAYNTARQQFHNALQIVSDIQFTTFQLAVLTDVGDFLLRTGRIQQGLSLLHFVRDDPAASQIVKKLAAQQIAYAKKTVSSTIYHASQPPADIQAATALALKELLITAVATESPLPILSYASSEIVEPLTEREQEILTLIAQGHTNKQIAESLFVVVGTIKAHNNRIFSKLGVSNRTQAIARARELGLIT